MRSPKPRCDGIAALQFWNRPPAAQDRRRIALVLPSAIFRSIKARTAANFSKNVSMYFLASACGTPMF